MIDKHKKVRGLLGIVASLFLLLLSPEVFAANNCRFSSTSSFNFGTISIPAGVAVGTPIGSASTMTVSMTCSVDNQNWRSEWGIFPSNAWVTTVPDAIWGLKNSAGVNLPIALKITNVSQNFVVTSTDSSSNHVVSNPAVSTYDTNGRLVYPRPEPIGNGTTTVQLSGQLYVAGPNPEAAGSGTLGLYFHWQTLNFQPSNGNGTPFTVSATIQPKTCQVTSPPSTNIGVFKAGNFTGVNYMSDFGADINVTVNCPGVAGKIYMTLSDGRNNGNISSTLPLTRTSTASGVGIQIWRKNGSLISFGPDSKTVGTTNQFLLYNSTGNNGPQTFSFSPRYIQTSPTVTPGSANGFATFTIAIQ